MIFAEKPDPTAPMDGGQGKTTPRPGGEESGGGRGVAALVKDRDPNLLVDLDDEPQSRDDDDRETTADPGAERSVTHVPRPSALSGSLGGAGPQGGGPGGHELIIADELGPGGEEVGNVRREVDLNPQQRIVLNVGGIRHETRLSTLKAIPNTRLSRLALTHIQLMLPLSASPSPMLTTPVTLSPEGAPHLFPPTEYFFDRHPSVFNSIIDFYRTGELHVPLEVCGAVVKRELDFWQIDEMEIKACCWRHYRSYIENQAILDSFNNSLIKESYNVNLDHLKGWEKFQMQVWLVLDHPRTSKLAMCYGIISFLFVSTSIAGFCLETLPGLRPEVAYNVTQECGGQMRTIPEVLKSNEVLYVMDIICTVFFSLELVMRFIFSPSKVRFVTSIMNIIDLLALVPLYVTVFFQAFNMQACYLTEQYVIEIMFILRIIRMFRIFHLVKHYQALKVLVYALKASLQELLMLFIFLLIAMLVFATMIYYAERQDATRPSAKFTTIPMGFWWAIITMTTVGYGDVYPVTTAGYVVGTCCCVAGVLLLALTFPVISNNFTLFYQHVRSRSAQQGHGQGRLSISSIHVSEPERGGGGLKGGGGGGGSSGRASGLRRNEEEEHLLRTPYSSPTHSVARKDSLASAFTEPLVNGGALFRVPSHAGSHPGAAAAAAAAAVATVRAATAYGAFVSDRLPAPILAKFSDSTSMTDIILSRGGQESVSPGRESLQRRRAAGGRSWDRHRSQGSATPSTRAGSISSRKTASEDGGLRYSHGETRL